MVLFSLYDAYSARYGHFKFLTLFSRHSGCRRPSSPPPPLGPAPDVYGGTVPEAAALDEDEKTVKEISDNAWGCVSPANSTIAVLAAFYFSCK